MNAPHRALRYVWTVKPGDSQVVLPLDSTYRCISGPTTSIATTSAYLTPGPYRHAWSGAIIQYTVKAATNDVTVLENILTGSAGTSADWEVQGVGGTVTITAGTTTTREFKPLSDDFQLRVNAGATGPTAFTMHITAQWSSDYGS